LESFAAIGWALRLSSAQGQQSSSERKMLREIGDVDKTLPDSHPPKDSAITAQIQQARTCISWVEPSLIASER
jgi:hypothetical protein